MKRRRLGLLAVRAIVTGGILIALFTWLGTEEFLAALKRTGLALWVFTAVTLICVHVAVVAKWRILLAAAGARVGMIEAWRAHGGGLFAGMYLPSLVGGEVVRVGLIAPRGRNLAAALTAGIADRLTDLVALIALTMAGLVFISAPSGAISLQGLVLPALGVLGSIAGFLLGVRLLQSRWLPQRIMATVSGLKQPFDTMRRRKGSALVAFAGSLAIQASFVLQNVVIARAIGIDIPVAAWFVAWPLAKLASLAPFSIGGLGVREGALAALLIPFSVAPSLAVAESLIWQSASYALGLFGGLTSLWIGTFASMHHETLVAAEQPHVDGSNQSSRIMLTPPAAEPRVQKT